MNDEKKVSVQQQEPEQKKSHWLWLKVGSMWAFFAGLLAFGSSSTPVYASVYEEPSLSVNFVASEMFQYAQVIIDALMPVIYVTVGIALGFMIIRALKSAFR